MRRILLNSWWSPTLWLGLSCAILFSTLCPCRANDIFVDNVGGDDRLDGSSLEKPGGFVGPTRTIAKALRIAGPGDRIVLTKNAEPYRESITLFGWQHSGASTEMPFVIQGNGAVLDGSIKVPAGDWEYYSGDVFRFTPPRLTYQQLFLAGRPAVRRLFDNTSGKFPVLEPKEWFLSDAHLYFRVEKGHLPQDYPLSFANLQTGITLYRVHNLAIFDLTLQGFQQDGLNAFDGVRHANLAGLTCRGNGRSGIAITNASQVDLAASLLGDNGYAQLLLEGYSDTHVSNCNLLDNSAPRFVRRGGRLSIDGRRVDGQQADGDK